LAVTVRPIIFISAVSKELRSARQLVANTLQLLGYEPDWQDIFGTEEGELRGMIRRRIDASAGVVQLVGQCYGIEPPTIDEQFGRVSYTQYEALYAKQRGKKVWYLLLNPDFTADPHDAEPEELRALQTAYRQRVREGDQLYYPLSSSDALEVQVLKLRDDLAQLRRRGKQWAAGVLALLVIIAALIIWQVRGGHQTQRSVIALQQEMKQLREGIAQYPSAEAKAREAQPGQRPEQIEERAYAELAKKLGIDARTLREKLPAFAEELKQSPDATTFERANAAFVAKDYAEAERLALNAAEEAQKADPSRIADAVKALELAGWSAENRIEYARAMNHFRAAAALTNRQRDAPEWARVQHEIAVVLADQGHSPEAEAILRDVVSVREQVIGPEHPDTLTSRNNLANALDAQGKYAEAEAEHRAVLKLREKVLGPEHPDTLRSRSNLANALYAQGKYAEAEAEHRAVLKLMEKVRGPEHPDTLGSRHNLATVLAAQDKYAEAEAEYRAVLKLEEKVLGPEHPDTLRSRNNLANALDAQGKYAEAEAECREVLKLEEKVLGPEHPNTLTSRVNLASALAGEDKYAEAEAEYRAVLKLREKVLGPEHPNTLASRDNLATVLAAQGKYAEAEAEYRAVLKLEEKVLGPEHHDTLSSRNNLASALDKQGKYAEAEAEYRAVLKLREKVLGPEHPDTLGSRNNLANALSDEGKYAEAEAENRALLKLAEKVLGPEHPDTLGSRYNLANALYGEGKYAEAEAEYRAVLKLREKVLGSEHPQTLISRTDLAWILATCPDAKIRNRSEAMALATNVCELSRWSNASYLDTLAAAEAEAGLFHAAVKHEQQALELAKAGKGNVKDFESRLSLYQQHKPYRTAAKH
jgi:tetratricopeptide (TPR) repeat protein